MLPIVFHIAVPFIYPAELKATLLERLRAAHATFLAREPHQQDDVAFFKWMCPTFHHWWLDDVLLVPPPTPGPWN
jgi:hypothetical protein